MKVSSSAGFAWGSAITVGALSSWVVGTTVMVAALLVESVIASRSLQPLVFVVVLLPIVGALLLPGALLAGGAAGCLARGTARTLSRRAHAAALALVGAVVGVVHANVILRSTPGLEVGNPALLLAEAGLAGAIAGVVLSTLVRKEP